MAGNGFKLLIWDWNCYWLQILKWFNLSQKLGVFALFLNFCRIPFLIYKHKSYTKLVIILMFVNTIKQERKTVYVNEIWFSSNVNGQDYVFWHNHLDTKDKVLSASVSSLLVANKRVDTNAARGGISTESNHRQKKKLHFDLFKQKLI